MKTWVKNMAIVLTTAMVSCGVMGCVLPAVAEQKWPLKIWVQNENGRTFTWNLVDDDTGVQYIVVTTEGTHSNSVAITPRLNSDGTLYVKQERVSEK